MHRRSLFVMIGIMLLGGMLAGHALANEQRSHPARNGHDISSEYGFQAFYDAHDGARMLGAPITDVVFEANTPVQYFEHARLENRAGTVIPGALGSEQTKWRSLPTLISQSTTNTNVDAFRQFWNDHEGSLLLGAPLGAPHWQQIEGASLRVQYYERGRLEARPSLGRIEIAVGKLGREIALAKGLVTTEHDPAQAIVQDNAEAAQAAFGSLLPTPTPLPLPTPVPAPTVAPVRPAPIAIGQVIDVDISTQSLVAYNNGIVAYEAWVATGKDGFDTPTGVYEINTKYDVQTMRGSLNGEDWVVPNVPSVMYFNGSVALHGTYWHNLFGSGTRLSHGCVNLSLPDAAWLYDWAPLGTTVVVHY